MINVNDSAAKVNDGVTGPGRRAAAPVRMIVRCLQFLQIVERRRGFAEQRNGLSGVCPEIASRSGKAARRAASSSTAKPNLTGHRNRQVKRRHDDSASHTGRRAPATLGRLPPETLPRRAFRQDRAARCDPKSACGAGACPLDCTPDPFRARRHFDVAHADFGEGVDDGVDDCGECGGCAAFARVAGERVTRGQAGNRWHHWRKTDSNPRSLFDRSSCDGNAAGGEEDRRMAAKFLVKQSE